MTKSTRFSNRAFQTELKVQVGKSSTAPAGGAKIGIEAMSEEVKCKYKGISNKELKQIFTVRKENVQLAKKMLNQARREVEGGKDS